MYIYIKHIYTHVFVCRGKEVGVPYSSLGSRPYSVKLPHRSKDSRCGGSEIMATTKVIRSPFKAQCGSMDKGAKVYRHNATLCDMSLPQYCRKPCPDYSGPMSIKQVKQQ